MRLPMMSTVLLPVAGLLLVWALAACSAAPSSAEATARVETRPRFIHTVLFWLKPGTSDEARRQLIDDCRRLLGSIPTVRYLAAGEPAGTPREVVDNSYQVGLVVHFDDKAGHDVYQEAAEHQDFIQRNQAIWERVQVYDLLVPAPPATAP